MTKVLYFNRETLEQKYLDDEQHRNAVQQYESLGWLCNPPLVHVVHPRSHDQKLIHADDWKQYEQRGYYRDPTWVYHPTEGSRVVPLEKAREMYSQGWYDNPSKFPGEKHGVMKLKSREVA